MDTYREILEAKKVKISTNDAKELKTLATNYSIAFSMKDEKKKSNAKGSMEKILQTYGMSWDEYRAQAEKDRQKRIKKTAKPKMTDADRKKMSRSQWGSEY